MARMPAGNPVKPEQYRLFEALKDFHTYKNKAKSPTHTRQRSTVRATGAKCSAIYGEVAVADFGAESKETREKWAFISPSDTDQDPTEITNGLQLFIAKAIDSPFVDRFVYTDAYGARISAWAEEISLVHYIEKKKESGKIPLAQVRIFIAQLILGIEALHNASLVHCDLRELNVLVRISDGKPYLVITDFDTLIAVDSNGIPLKPVTFTPPPNLKRLNCNKKPVIPADFHQDSSLRDHRQIDSYGLGNIIDALGECTDASEDQWRDFAELAANLTDADTSKRINLAKAKESCIFGGTDKERAEFFAECARDVPTTTFTAPATSIAGLTPFLPPKMQTFMNLANQEQISVETTTELSSAAKAIMDDHELTSFHAFVTDKYAAFIDAYLQQQVKPIKYLAEKKQTYILYLKNLINECKLNGPEHEDLRKSLVDHLLISENHFLKKEQHFFRKEKHSHETSSMHEAITTLLNPMELHSNQKFMYSVAGRALTFERHQSLCTRIKRTLTSLF